MRVIVGDDLALKYVVTVTTDRILLVPMTYAAITGILVWRRVRFANKRHRALFTASVAYIAGSVPLHVYLDYVINDVSFVTWFPMWFSYLLLIVVYPAFLTMFWRLRYKDAEIDATEPGTPRPRSSTPRSAYSPTWASGV